jgi:tetratricopeptide (TPR) repeat protein
MSSALVGKVLALAFVAVLVSSALGSGCSAQSQSSGPNLNVSGNEMEERMELSNMDALGDKEEIAAYKNFIKEQAPAKKIQLGANFLKKYPKSKLAERVDVGMMDAYDAQQDWKNTFLFADSALALQPDDVDALTIVGWTIPHVYTPNDPDADQELDKAEKYSKRAIEVLATMHKPSAMNDTQFATAKAKRESRAHSALGLVYFRRDDYENSAKELRLATTGNPVQDQTDLFVLGVDLQNLKRYDEAAEAFTACGQIAGALQGQCTQNANLMRALAKISKAK